MERFMTLAMLVEDLLMMDALQPDEVAAFGDKVNEAYDNGLITAKDVIDCYAKLFSKILSSGC